MLLDAHVSCRYACCRRDCYLFAEANAFVFSCGWYNQELVFSGLAGDNVLGLKILVNTGRIPFSLFFGQEDFQRSLTSAQTFLASTKRTAENRLGILPASLSPCEYRFLHVLLSGKTERGGKSVVSFTIVFTSQRSLPSAVSILLRKKLF